MTNAMEPFVGRHNELQVLAEAYRSGRSALIPVYGRRRVGKSELILHFLKKKSGIYFAGKRGQPAVQIHEFLQEAARVLGEPLLAGLAAGDWGAALTAVTDRWRGKGKLILALDEFQWTAEASPELPSVLQGLWDRRWARSGKVLLILCGSYVGFMEREVLGKRSPLFGRRTAQIHLKPFGYREAAKFHPSYSLVDRARTYFICGGVPLYLQYFAPDRSVEMNIAANFLNPYGPLFQEPEFLLREELREVENYYAVLMALAGGSAAQRDIAERTGLDSRVLHYYLSQLIELGYLAKRYPLTGRPPVARHVRYAVEDPVLRFWFRFVYPNISFILQKGGAAALDERISPSLEAYFGSCFERLCREALPVLYEREEVRASFEVGEYWDRDVQIDVVGLRGDRWTDLGECKWGSVPSARAVEAELEAKVVRFPNARQASIGRHVFARQRPKGAGRRATGFHWRGLEDLY
jgi:AAA+ ATPase superfamily predicted ATPase